MDPRPDEAGVNYQEGLGVRPPSEVRHRFQHADSSPKLQKNLNNVKVPVFKGVKKDA